MRRMLKELQALGYASGFGKPDAHADAGRFGSADITIYESPADNPNFQLADQPTPEKPSSVTPTTAQPTPETPTPEKPSLYKRQIVQKTNSTNTHTHTAAYPAKAPANDSGNPVCVCRFPHASEFCDDVRIAYARNRPDVRNPVGYGKAPDFRAGLYDEAVREWLMKVENPASSAPLRDTSACPDCHGRGMAVVQKEGRSGAIKCKHPRLDEELTRLYREVEASKRELRAGVPAR